MRWLAIALMFFAGIAARADDPVVVSAGRIPHVFDPDLPGAYNRVFDLMIKGISRPVTIEYFPLTGAMRRLALPEYDCFAMALENSPNWSRLGMNAADFTFIGPIAWLEIKVYVRAEDAGKEIKSLSGVRVSADSTIVNLQNAFDDRWISTQITGTDSFVEALDTLVTGKSTAALAYDVDVRALGVDHRLAGKFVDTDITVARFQDGMMCKSTVDLLPVILGLQENLDKIAADGTLGRLLDEPDF